MFKLLVNTPSGAQEIVEVDANGGYFDAASVLWDERADGPLPSITLGGMKRVGNNLVFDQTIKDAYDSVVLAEGKEKALARINQGYTIAMQVVVNGYPMSEIDSWSKQESEARAYTADPVNAVTPLLSAMASARGITIAELASRVILKADLFAASAGAIIGKRQKLEDQIGLATSLNGLDNIVW